MLSLPSIVWIIVLNLGSSLSTYSFDTLSPMKSQILRVFLASTKVDVLLVMDGTVVNAFPPHKPINSWVLPAPLSPIIAISVLLGFDFFLRVSRMKINMAAAMR